jgi:glucose-6-phosphate isomerase
VRNDGIVYDYNGVLSEAVGGIHGVSREEIIAFQEQTVRYHEEMMGEKKAGRLGFMDLPYREKEAREITDRAEEWRKGVDTCLVLGIGGSSLGGRALRDAIKTPLYNLQTAGKRAGFPRLFFAENIDPEGFTALLDLLDLKRTLIVVISKSGGTAETMSQFLILSDKMKKALGDNYASRIVAITDPEKGTLRDLADRERFATLDIPSNIGGRFSVFTPVGLFPAAVIGIDIRALLEGARAMANRCATAALEENPAYLNAVIHYIFDTKKGKPLSVLMPYADCLLSVADWYRQLYAESLGKRETKDGREVFCGPTPIRALGVTDQHSQLQLYMAGPFDKVVTFIRVEKTRQDVEIPRAFSYETQLDYLSGHTLKQLTGFEQRATAHALMENNRPTITLRVPEISAYTVGQILYFFELQVAFAGYLYGINPFDQPGVERGKILTYGLMGRKGYEKYVREMKS